ncbi:unnamed protein product [Thlaspi arvense]|uniref:Serpin domain-containing protein n=1 Tax=Thlaspi arvense TaxID=13288 RepID=A0AAU9RT99_THLAR|nr:unnamed protein product [Thlaspi arvense]CAH2046469.1 unnamed protein product [Thlaspi arvense]
MSLDLSRCVSNSTIEEAIKNQNDIALVLSKHIFSKAKHSNAIFSPASIYAALTLAASGPTNGSSLVSDEIVSFLRSPSIDELNAIFSEIVSVVLADRSANGSPKISSVNGVWVEQSLQTDPSFKDLFENSFKARFERVDFRSKAEEVRIELNSWISKHTNGLIEDVLPPGSVTHLTECAYGNALYFKGKWKDSFDKSCTSDREFHPLNGTSVSVPFMSSYRKQYLQAYDGFKVLKIPYRKGSDDTNRSFSMYFYLPDKNDGLDHLVKTMASTSGFLDSHVPSWKVSVNQLRIPKFKMDYRLDGGKVLSELGLRSMSLYHKACVEIDEEGAEAAAATFVLATTTSSCYMEPMIDFVADHPFLFLTREDKSGTVLFVGQIFDPSNKSS